MAKGVSRRRKKAGMAALVLVLVLVGIIVLARTDTVRSIIESRRSPPKPFAATTAPPAPDYGRASAWFALPGRNGLERSVPQGLTPIDERTAPADVFFIHPTMYLKNDVWNAPYDVAGTYDAPVLMGQLSAFNGCCRLYAPHYRQASLKALHNPPAVALAYSDVARAFRYYIAHFNHGRPFIIASHSQGTGHAVRLLQEAIIGTPLQARLVAAYTIGAFTPETFAGIGLPTCDTPDETGCILSWNTSQSGRTGASLLTRDVVYWWQGAPHRSGGVRAVCVNPLTWTAAGTADSSANTGSLPFPKAPFPTAATMMPPLVPNLVGAVCHDHLLDVDLPWTAPSGFRDVLSLGYGSYHKSDFGLFYAIVRENTMRRVESWGSKHRSYQGYTVPLK